MASPVKINFKIYQGSTFNEVLRWESATKIYVNITSIFQTAPMVVTANGHGIPVGWRAKISNVLGMTEANSSEYNTVTSADINTVTFNSINAIGYKPYLSGGILEYNQPISLVGYTARMQIREKLSSSIVLEELTTENGKIVIDNNNKTITLNIAASTTQNYSFKSAVYSLELINGAIVTPFIYGSISLDSEVTR